MAEDQVIPGQVNEHELAQIQEQIKDEHDAFSDYITIRELSYVSRISIGRIRHALTYARYRPMSGIKRGPLWFISKLEALRWAQVVATYEMNRWESNLKRIGKAQKRVEAGKPIQREIAPYAFRHFNYDKPPEGRKVYTYKEAAAVLGTTINTMYFYTSVGHELGDITRYVGPDRTKLLDAEPIDAFAERRGNEPIMLRKDGEPDRRGRHRDTPAMFRKDGEPDRRQRGRDSGVA